MIFKEKDEFLLYRNIRYGDMFWSCGDTISFTWIIYIDRKNINQTWCFEATIWVQILRKLRQDFSSAVYLRRFYSLANNTG